MNWQECDSAGTDPKDMYSSTGLSGDTFTLKTHFREFVRLNIGSKWYLVSDYKPWKVHFEFKKSSGIWVNNGSVLEENNDGWEENNDE